MSDKKGYRGGNMEEKLITKIFNKLNDLTIEELDTKLNLHEITYISNYLENVQIDLFLKGKLKRDPMDYYDEVHVKELFGSR
jgi:hypothetical protein